MKKEFVAYGEELCRDIENGNMEDALETIGNGDGSVRAFDITEDSLETLLNDLRGNLNFITITEEEFNTLSN